MAETVTDVLVAGSQEIEEATRDSESLAVGLFAPLLRPMRIRLSPARYVGGTK